MGSGVSLHGSILNRPCPLWVISGHRRMSSQCPLYPQKRTSSELSAGRAGLSRRRAVEDAPGCRAYGANNPTSQATSVISRTKYTPTTTAMTIKPRRSVHCVDAAELSSFMANAVDQEDCVSYWIALAVLLTRGTNPSAQNSLQKNWFP
jgi:hypothetical protein